MTASRSEPADAQDGDDVTDRDVILDLLEDGIREAHRKVEDGRVYDAENERVRIQWIRALAYSVNVHRQTLKDKELDEMNERLEALEAWEGDSL
jgi:hypothetical protein